ncbi:hypothetical protein F5Y12DRAFT_793704 [Xylaria sp. FL1777]|nr:hypothetical protein F5Y12DRAFT_793704 [Xylaria sp. FL1777]
MSAANKASQKASKNQGTSYCDPIRNHTILHSFEGLEAKITAIQGTWRGVGCVLGASKRYSGLVIQDFSFPSSTASPNALVNPYDVEAIIFKADRITDTSAITNTETDTDTDTHITTYDRDNDTGGWLASHKRAHRRAIRHYLAAAAAYVKATSPNPEANTEVVSMAAETKTCDKDSAVAGVGGANDVARPVGFTGGDCLSKANFFERCGKVLNKKRSFWKKKED